MIPSRAILRALQRVQNRRRRLAPLLVIGVAALAAALVVGQASVRSFEADAAGFLAARVTDAPVAVRGDSVAMASGDGDWLRFIVTPECSTVLLVVPFLLLCGVVVAVSLPSIGRWVTMLAVGSALLVLINVVRLTVVISGTELGSVALYPLLHSGVGTAIVLVGATLALIVSMRICFPTSTGVR